MPIDQLIPASGGGGEGPEVCLHLCVQTITLHVTFFIAILPGIDM